MHSSTYLLFQGSVPCPPRSHIDKEPRRWHIKLARERRSGLPNTTTIRSIFAFDDHLNDYHAALESASEVSPNGGPGSCCGMTKKGEPCKNSIKVKDTKIGHQKLATLARQPFDVSSLQPKLCDIARDFLCARWHRHRQADQVGQQWYEAAVRNQARNGFSISHSTAGLASNIVSLQAPPLTSRAQTRPPGAPGNQPRASVAFQSIYDLYNTTDEQCSMACFAGLTGYSGAGFQELTLRSLTTSKEVNSIHYVFCLTEDEDHANKCVILRCQWLQKRDIDFSTSCCVCRNDGALDALVRPLPIPTSDAETHSVHTASESSPASGPRRSARLAGPHIPGDPSTSVALRRSARLSNLLG
ncbi:hypothetical protein N7455_004274 [Penicillium solitum]|uniref:uncharacterized protein n=1 Tax=Penicillium solitum TaxID=60172 RepID=UPI0032C4AE01|nr:hypothetical protein N7455_004274 [Penicillium solitum]